MLNVILRLYETVLLCPCLVQLGLGAEFIFATQCATVGNRMVALRILFKDSYGFHVLQGALEMNPGSDPAGTDSTTVPMVSRILPEGTFR